MLVAPFLAYRANPAAIGAALALATGFSSHLSIFAKGAGIIVVEQGSARGVHIGAAEVCRAAVPVTLLCQGGACRTNEEAGT